MTSLVSMRRASLEDVETLVDLRLALERESGHLTQVDALILSACVQMPSLPLIEPAEAEFDLPVLSAATATAFTLLRRLGLPTVLPGARHLLQKDRREVE